MREGVMCGANSSRKVPKNLKKGSLLPIGLAVSCDQAVRISFCKLLIRLTLDDLWDSSLVSIYSLVRLTKIFCFLIVHPSRSFASLEHLSWNSASIRLWADL